MASLSSIPATFLERHVGFWMSYVVATTSLFIAVTMLVLFSSKLGETHTPPPPLSWTGLSPDTDCYSVKVTPGKNCLPQAIRVLVAAARSGFRLDHAKPNYQQESRSVIVTWNDSFVDELKIGLHACRVMYVFEFFIQVRIASWN